MHTAASCSLQTSEEANEMPPMPLWMLIDTPNPRAVVAWVQEAGGGGGGGGGRKGGTAPPPPPPFFGLGGTKKWYQHLQIINNNHADLKT